MLVKKHRGETVTPATTVGFAQVRGAPPWANAFDIRLVSTTIEAVQLALEPRIQRVYYFDASAGQGTYSEQTRNATDRNTATDVNLDAFAVADRLYVGCRNRFRGLAIDVDEVNATASVATWEYWNGSAWVDIADTDGTIAAGATLAQDGLVTWTPPVNWEPVELEVPNKTERLFWVRLTVSVALDATRIEGIVALFNNVVNAATSDAEGNATIRFVSNAGASPPYFYRFERDKFGGIELASASLTTADSVLLNWYET